MAINIPPNSSESREGLPKGHRVWDVKKGAAEDTKEVYFQADSESLRRHGTKISFCSETITLGERVNSNTGESKYEAFSLKCRQRHCPVCQSARAMKLHSNFMRVFPLILKRVPNGRFLFLTLTVRNCLMVELRETLIEMNNSFRRLTRKPEFKIVEGWLKATEVTLSDNDMVHPHFHILLLVPPSYFGRNYIKQCKWIELWKESAKLNYLPSVDIRCVKTIKGGVREVVKTALYGTKSFEPKSNPKLFLEYHQQVQSLRFLSTGGVIKEFLSGLDRAESSDIVESSEEEGDLIVGERRYAWNSSHRKYYAE